MSEASQLLLEFGEFRIDPRKRTLARASGELIALTPKHFDTLLYLLENAGEVLEKDRLMSAIWPGMIVEENNLSQAISNLRRILGDNGAEYRYILTVPRRGYRFVAQVREAAVQAPKDLPIVSTSGPVGQLAPSNASRVAAGNLPPPAKIDALVPAGARPAPMRLGRMWIAGTALLLMLVIAVLVWKMPPKDNAAVNDKSIAVLPFINFSGAKEDEFFSDGITEDLVTQLAQISGLKVISRTSILEYKDSKKSLRDIARELGVAHILQGSVRRSESRFRITAQLIDPAKEGHLWAKSYDRDIKDVLAVQSEVTAEIAAALKTRLLEPERNQLEKRARGNPQAYVLYRKGTHLMEFHPSRTIEGRQRAREYFERVIEMDPASPLGYAGLANFHFRSALWRDLPRAEAYARAEVLAKKALAADEQSAEANLMLATIYAQVHWDWQKAEPFAKRAVQLSPGEAEVWDGYRSNVLQPTGRLDEALAAQQHAVSLDPLNVGMAQGLAHVLKNMRRCDEAIKQARVNLELDSKFFLQYVIVGRCHEMNGNYLEAIAAWRLVKRPWLPDNVLDELQALIASPVGKADPKAYWRARLAWSKKYGETAQDQHYFTAAFAAQAGDKDEAFHYLNRAIDERDREMGATKVDPQFDPIRNDPRFAAVLKRLNLD